MELKKRISFEDERRFAQVQLDGWGDLTCLFNPPFLILKVRNLAMNKVIVLGVVIA